MNSHMNRQMEEFKDAFIKVQEKLTLMKSQFDGDRALEAKRAAGFYGDIAQLNKKVDSLAAEVGRSKSNNLCK